MTAPLFRRATRADLERIVELLADDSVNGWRENAATPLAAAYERAFAAIDADTAHLLVVGEMDGAIVATGQITFVPNLTQQGGARAIVEGVRVASRLRSRGVGELLIAHLCEEARARGCVCVQLTTSHPRSAAQRFYARIGFSPSHVGFKKNLV